MNQNFNEGQAKVEYQPHISHLNIRGFGKLVGNIYEHCSQHLRENSNEEANKW